MLCSGAMSRLLNVRAFSKQSRSEFTSVNDDLTSAAHATLSIVNVCGSSPIRLERDVVFVRDDDIRLPGDPPVNIEHFPVSNSRVAGHVPPQEVTEFAFRPGHPVSRMLELLADVLELGHEPPSPDGGSRT